MTEATATAGLVVTVAHLRTIRGYGRRPGFCLVGARAFFRRHGLDWVGFVRSGIQARQLVDTGDALALALVEHALREEKAHEA